MQRETQDDGCRVRLQNGIPVKNVAIFLGLAGWLVNGVLLAYYLFHSPGAFSLAGVNVTYELINRQALGTLWVLIGLLLAAIPLIWKQYPNVVIPLSPLFYLIVWFSAGPFLTTGLVGGYKLAWKVATTLHLFPSFIVRDVLLPVIFLLALATTLSSMLVKKEHAPKRIK